MFQGRLQRGRQEHVREGVGQGGDPAADCGQKSGQEPHLCALWFVCFFITLLFILLHHSDKAPSASLRSAHLKSFLPGVAGPPASVWIRLIYRPQLCRNTRLVMESECFVCVQRSTWRGKKPRKAPIILHFEIQRMILKCSLMQLKPTAVINVFTRPRF